MFIPASLKFFTAFFLFLLSFSVLTQKLKEKNVCVVFVWGFHSRVLLPSRVRVFPGHGVAVECAWVKGFKHVKKGRKL